MDKRILFALCIVTFLLFSACNWTESDYKRFTYELQGTWESNDPSDYSGTLVITYNRITITGYDENQGQFFDPLSWLPFRGIIKNTPWDGYSEHFSNDDKSEGKIYIRNAGDWVEFSFRYFRGDYSQGEFLRITFGESDFGGRVEVLRKK